MATRVEADLLIPGLGDPIPHGCVVFDGPTISYAGPIEDAPASATSDATVSVPVVMPGLWDTHTHFFGLRNLSVDEQVYSSDWVNIVRAARDAEKALHAGFTSVRELGGFGIYLARAVDDGSIVGPHIYAAGTALCPTGGHGDAPAFPIEFVHFWRNLLEFPGPCDGVPACFAAVRKVLRLGAPIVKIYVTGGALSNRNSHLHQQFSDEEIRAIVDEAARADRIVAAHCIGKAGILAALKAGVKTIEHGSLLDEECADLMLEKGALLVPTFWIMMGSGASGKESGIPETMREKERQMVDRHREAIRLAVRKKIPIAMGSDTQCSTEAATTYWGGNGHELRLMVEQAGMTPLQAIEAATANGPRTLGPRAPLSGQLRAGYAADLIAVQENPLKRIAALSEPDRIVRVWKGGRLAVERSIAP
jgi:imidazolonepropionase-like amidohydrolase